MTPSPRPTQPTGLGRPVLNPRHLVVRPSSHSDHAGKVELVINDFVFARFFPDEALMVAELLVEAANRIRGSSP